MRQSSGRGSGGSGGAALNGNAGSGKSPAGMKWLIAAVLLAVIALCWGLRGPSHNQSSAAAYRTSSTVEAHASAVVSAGGTPGTAARAGNTGHQSAEYEYEQGRKYYNGWGVTKNYPEAVKWFRKSAEHGHSAAQYDLGWMYERGLGVTRDYAAAVKWYRLAAEQGNPGAWDSLGVMYEYGRGVTRDYAEALKWYRKAAAQGIENARSGTARLEKLVPVKVGGNADGKSQGAAAADAGTGKLGSKAGEYEHKQGVKYYLGRGVSQDYSEAVKWFRKSADLGNARGYAWLGVMYGTGRGVSGDFKEALKWIRKSAGQGDAFGEHLLGIMYRDGIGVSRDSSEALEWFRKSAGHGDAPGQYDLGRMYETGSGVKRDYAEALRWYRKAAAQGNEDAKGGIERLEKENNSRTGGNAARKSQGSAAADDDPGAVSLFGRPVYLRGEFDDCPWDRLSDRCLIQAPEGPGPGAW